MGYYAFAEPGGLSAWWNAGAWGVLPLFVLFGLAPFLMWGFIYRRHSDPNISLPMAFALGMANWAYGYLQQAASWWAFVRVARNRHDWKKTAHTRPADERILAPTGLPSLAGVFTPRSGPESHGPSPVAPHRRLVRPSAAARFVLRPPSPQSAPSLLPISPAPAGTSSQPNHGRIPALVSSEDS